MHVDAATVHALCEIAGIELLEDDMELLAALLGNQLGAAASLLPVETADVEPIVTFDPRWR